MEPALDLILSASFLFDDFSVFLYNFKKDFFEYDWKHQGKNLTMADR